MGYSDTPSNQTHAFLWQSGSGTQDLGTLGGYSDATGINNSDQVAGWSHTSRRPRGPKNVIAVFSSALSELSVSLQ